MLFYYCNYYCTTMNINCTSRNFMPIYVYKCKKHFIKIVNDYMHGVAIQQLFHSD